MNKNTSIKSLKQHHKAPLSLINQPAATNQEKLFYERIACVMQGGGALGIYQVGAYRAIQERGYSPNYLTGVSIGGINAAIIAGNPPEKQIEKLMAFWEGISPKILNHVLSNVPNTTIFRDMRNLMGAMYPLMFGLDGFFKPRLIHPWIQSENTPDKLSYYDTSELRTTLENLIDFDLINEKKTTLCLGAVNVESGEMIFFNNQKMKLTVEHVMASAALPPGFPAVKIDNEYYWDGGIYANTPLVTVLDAVPELDTLCFVIDCFRLKGALPTNMDKVEERQKDIRFASHSRRLTNIYTARQNLQSAIQFLSDKLTPESKKDPEVQEILKLGYQKNISLVHLIYNGAPWTHSYKDYNFVNTAISNRMEEGYKDTIAVLDQPDWENKSAKTLNCSIYGVQPDYFDQH